MKVSFICTVYNEESTIDAFLISINKQTKQADEIIITDAGSKDKTVEKLKQFQKESKVPVKIIIKHGNRSIGRNQAIKHASGDIITCSDAGCILDKNWLKNITHPFLVQNKIPADVVAGYYLPKTTNIFEKCLATYTCVMSDKIDKDNFLPSSRSIAFKKSAWKQINGYPEQLKTCEDLIFATQLKKTGCHFTFTEKAIVYWPQRKNILLAFKQFFSYAIGDGQAHFIRPSVPFLFLRYLIAIIIIATACMRKSLPITVVICLGVVVYLCWAIKKNYKYINHTKALLYLPILQLTADIAVLIGTSLGFFKALFNPLSKNTYKISFSKILPLSLFVIMLLMLFIRSGIFTIRLVNELKTSKQSQREFMSQIQPCKQIKHQLNAEEQHILNYRSLGITCKK